MLNKEQAILYGKQVGVRYRIYGEAYGLYDTMPRLTVRYTYLIEK